MIWENPSMPRSLRVLLPLVACCSLVFVCSSRADESARFTGPWDLEQLQKAPPATWGEKSGLVQEVYYEGEPLDGKPTRVFAYYGRPAIGDGPFAGMVLVHGGGGTAFAEWATLWAERGYAAIAMDLAGCGPGRKRLPDGGPDQGHDRKFADFTDDRLGHMWTYHAVAAVIRGHSLLASRPEVDEDRIGITGISWGGYLTCIVTGLDDRLKVSVPVYGCGFLHENSAWLSIFEKMGPEKRDRWVRHFDPSRYLPGVSCPILFTNGTNDFAYPLDSYQKSYRLAPGRVDLRIEVRMPHSHPAGWAPKEIGLYCDSVLTGGDPLPRLGPMQTAGGSAKATFTSKVPVVEGHLHYTTDSGPWQKRTWHTVEAKLDEGTVAADLPAERPIVCYLSVTDERGAMVSTEHVGLPASGA
jgi:dienelactone hydrolase